MTGTLCLTNNSYNQKQVALMKHKGYSSMPSGVHRRDFLKITAGTGLVLAVPGIWGKADARTERIKTNIDGAVRGKKTRFSLPGPFPGKVVEIHDPAAVVEDRTHGEVVNAMFERGVTGLTGKNMKQSFKMFFTKKDVVGIKVNPVGPGLISTHPELVDAIINWLTGQGIPRKNIIIWDRFDYMLADAGFPSERFPGIGLEGLQTMDETAGEDAARGQSGAK